MNILAKFHFNIYNVPKRLTSYSEMCLSSMKICVKCIYVLNKNTYDDNYIYNITYLYKL